MIPATTKHLLNIYIYIGEKNLEEIRNKLMNHFSELIQKNRSLVLEESKSPPLFTREYKRVNPSYNNFVQIVQ